MADHPRATDMLRGAAHLLRTPLTVILGMTATLREYDHRFTSEQRAGYLGEVLHAAEEMRAALDGLSLLARALSGSLTFNPAPIALDALLRAGGEALAEVWGGNAVQMQAVDAGMVVVADAERTRQALGALARGATPTATTALRPAPGPGATLLLGPLSIAYAMSGVEALLRAPVASLDLGEVIAQPGGWPLLVARSLLEGQGAALSAVADGDLPGAATLAVHVPLRYP